MTPSTPDLRDEFTAHVRTGAPCPVPGGAVPVTPVGWRNPPTATDPWRTFARTWDGKTWNASLTWDEALQAEACGTICVAPDPSIYPPEVLAKGTPILPEEARAGDHVVSCEMPAEEGSHVLQFPERYAWLRLHPAPSPAPVAPVQAPVVDLRNKYEFHVDLADLVSAHRTMMRGSPDPTSPASALAETANEERDYCQRTLPPEAEIQALRIQVHNLESRITELNGWCATKEEIARRSVDRAEATEAERDAAVERVRVLEAMDREISRDLDYCAWPLPDYLMAQANRLRALLEKEAEG